MRLKLSLCVIGVGLVGCARTPLAGMEGDDSAGTSTNGGSTGMDDGTTSTSTGDPTPDTGEEGTETGGLPDVPEPELECHAIAESVTIADVEVRADLGTIKLEIDNGDRPHVFFLTEETVSHAIEGLDEWEVTSFDAPYLQKFAAAVDADRRVHIAYLYEGSLQYHTDEGGDWASESADLGGCSVTSMTVADDGTVHVAGVDDELLCYGTREDGMWTEQTMGKAFGRGSSLALWDGQPHIFYYQPGGYHAWHDGADWQSMPIAPGGIDNDLAVGPNGTFYVAHSESPFGATRLTWGQGQEWETYELSPDSNPWHTTAPTVARDSAGGLHIVFPANGDSGCLQHGTADSPDGPWTIDEVIPDAVDFGHVGVDSQDRVFVAYAERGSANPVLVTLD